MQSFNIEGKMSFLNDEEQIFCELMCEKCKNIVRTKIIKGSDCGNCQEHTLLTPSYERLSLSDSVKVVVVTTSFSLDIYLNLLFSLLITLFPVSVLHCLHGTYISPICRHKDYSFVCRFQVQITDGSGSTTATLLGELGENLLSMRAEQIYETINIKKDPLPLQYIEEDLVNKVFKIQLRKSYSRNSDAAPVKLFVSSFVEKQDALQLPTSSASLDVGENSKRELDNASLSDEPKKPTIGSTSSSKRQQLERTTPSKKNVSSSKREGIEPITPAKIK
ncbi:hypothetical protein P3S68_015047 [Capsicum galapagoense]